MATGDTNNKQLNVTMLAQTPGNPCSSLRERLGILCHSRIVFRIVGVLGRVVHLGLGQADLLHAADVTVCGELSATRMTGILMCLARFAAFATSICQLCMIQLMLPFQSLVYRMSRRRVGSQLVCI